MRKCILAAAAAAVLMGMSLPAAGQPIAAVAAREAAAPAVDTALLSDGSGEGTYLEVTYPVSDVYAHGKTFLYVLGDDMELRAEIVTDAPDETVPADVVRNLLAAEWTSADGFPVEEGGGDARNIEKEVIYSDVNVAYACVDASHEQLGGGVKYLICRPAGGIYHLETEIFVRDGADEALASEVVNASCIPQNFSQEEYPDETWDEAPADDEWWVNSEAEEPAEEKEMTDPDEDPGMAVPDENTEMTDPDQADSIIGWMRDQIGRAFEESGNVSVESSPESLAEEPESFEELEEYTLEDRESETSDEEDLQTETSGTDSVEEPADEPGEEIRMSFGTLELPAGWVLNEEFSSENRAVFVPADWDGEEKTDYITAEHGENRYAADDLHSFSEAILRQLLQQAQGATVTGYGGVTEQELPALVYEISDGADGTSAAQYYIVEDYGYVLINAANADDGDDDVLGAAEYITDSFTFAE